MQRYIRAAAICLLPLLLVGSLSLTHAQTPPTVILPTPAHDPEAQAHRDAAQVLAAKYDYAGAIAEYQAAYLRDKDTYPDATAIDLNSLGVSLQPPEPICQGN